MNPTPFRLTVTLALALWALPAAAAPEADADAVRSATVKLINQLVEQGVLTRDKADALLAEMNKPAAAPPPAPVRVPYMPEFMRKELKDEVQLDLAAQAAREGWAKAGSVPAWVRSLVWDGDVRTRYQFDNYAPDNAPAVNVTESNRAGQDVLFNTTDDRRRWRVRARLGVHADVDENWSAAVRLTTGNATDPLSSNQTLGNSNNRFTVLIDRAHIRYRQGDVFNAVAGRFGNPWFSTDLLWANDLGFDGLAAQWTPLIGPRLRGFVTLAALPLQEFERSTDDRWLFGAQAGATWLGTPTEMGGKLGLAYYHYKNIVGQRSPDLLGSNEHTAIVFAQKGNSRFDIADVSRPLKYGLASEYHLVNITGQVDFPVGAGKRVMVTGDYVRNIGFDRAEVSQRIGVDTAPETTAHHLRFTYGHPEVKLRGDWQVSAAYKRIERDAVLDAYTDSDFRLGGTDAKGYILGGSYGVGKNTAASLRYFSGDAISGPQLSIDVIQLDLSVRF